MTTGIVLAGGRSARFAAEVGASKLDVQLVGRTVLDRTVDAVRTACAAVIVVGRAAGPRDDVTYLPDDTAFDGPLAGIRLGLEAAEEPTVVAIGGDMPLARPEVLALLGAQLGDDAIDAAVLADGDRWRPLPLALRTATALVPIVRALERGERSIHGVVAGLRIDVLAERTWRAIDPAGDTLLDIDTPADLAAVEARLRA